MRVVGGVVGLDDGLDVGFNDVGDVVGLDVGDLDVGDVVGLRCRRFMRGRC